MGSWKESVKNYKKTIDNGLVLRRMAFLSLIEGKFFKNLQSTNNLLLSYIKQLV